MDGGTALRLPGAAGLAASATLLCAGAIVWVAPEKGIAVLLFLGAGAAAFAAPVLEQIKRTVAGQLSDVITHSLFHLFDEQRLDRILFAISEAVRKAITNEQVKSALKEAVVESAQSQELQLAIVGAVANSAVSAWRDEGLREAFLDVTKSAIADALKDQGFLSDLITTLAGAAVMASNDRQLRSSMLGVVKDAVAEALKDDAFLAEMVSTITRASISASQDEALKGALLRVTKDAVTEALKDEGFMSSFREAMCQSLKDSNIYRAAAAGVVGSLNPFGLRGRGSADNQTNQT